MVCGSGLVARRVPHLDGQENDEPNGGAILRGHPKQIAGAGEDVERKQKSERRHSDDVSWPEHLPRV